MADIEEALRQAGGGQPLIGAVRPNHSLINTGDPAIDLVLSQLMMNMAGPGKFLPQQFPAQNLLDQMVSAKYARSTKILTDGMRAEDNKELYKRMRGMIERVDDKPMSELGAAQLKNSTQYVNNDLTQALFSATIGPQAMEDFFFGQRGSQEMLAKSVSNIGFYRPDSVTGRNRMTDESLKTFTTQLYGNLYGPDADLNDISGFSAGRTGTIMTDLARRGLLPASIGKLDDAERKEAFKSAGVDKMKFSDSVVADQAIKGAMGSDSSIEDITKISGGADAVRKVDATRVANTLKEYSKAISTVREIFGDNGIADAPMGQLLAAMEALTQNSMGSVGPGKLENLMRRTQMAARDSGVSLEGLLGLSARAGALADQNGLPREYAQEASISAMERVKALRATGGFVPGFGRMDPDKAALAMLEQNVRADSSPVARYMAVAQRAISENLLNPAAAGGDAQLKSLVEAIGSGQTMMYDPVTKKQVDIYGELGRNPSEFLKPIFDAAGLTPELINSLYNSPGTKEYLGSMQGRQFHNAQGPEIKARLAHQLAGSGRFLIAGNSASMDDASRVGLNNELSTAFAETSVDVVSTQMKSEDRIAALRDSMRNVYIRRVFASGSRAPDDIHGATELANTQMREAFGGDAGINQFIGARLAETEANAPGLFKGLTLAQIQQQYSSRAVRAAAQEHRANMSQINLFDGLRGDGSNPLQRASDYIVSGKGKAFDAILGTVDRGTVVDKIKGSMQEGDVDRFDKTYEKLIGEKNALYVDTAEERDAALKAAADGKLSDVIEQFSGTAVHKDLKTKTEYKTTEQVSDDISAALADGTKLTAAADFYAKHVGGTFDKTNRKHLNKLAEIEGIHSALGMTIAPNVVTEGQLKELLDTPKLAFNVNGPKRAEMIKREAAFDKYNKSLLDGTTAAKDVLEMHGMSDAVVNNKEINETLGKFLKEGQTGQADELMDQLAAAGVTDTDQIASLLSTSRGAYAIGQQGGLKAIDAKSANEFNVMNSRSMAFLDALGNDKGEGRMVKGDSELADVVRKNAKGETLTDKERELFKKSFGTKEAFETAVKGELIEFNDGGTKFGAADDKERQRGGRKEAAQIITDKADKLMPPDLASLGGMGGGIAAIGTNIASAVKEAFKGEVTIQTAKVEKLDIQLGNLASSIISGVFAAAAPEARDGDLKGTVQIAGDLKTIMMNLVKAATPGVEIPPGVDGAPVHTTAGQA